MKRILIAALLSLLAPASLHAATISTDDVFDVSKGGSVSVIGFDGAGTLPNIPSLPLTNIIGGDQAPPNLSGESQNVIFSDQPPSGSSQNTFANVLITTLNAVSLTGVNLFLSGDGAATSNRFADTVEFLVYNGAGDFGIRSNYTQLFDVDLAAPYSDTVGLPSGVTLNTPSPNVAELSASFASTVTGTNFLLRISRIDLPGTSNDPLSPRVVEIDAVSAVPVPLPAGLPMLLAGLMGLGLVARWRRAA